MSDGAASSRLAVLLFTDLVGSTELKSRLGTPAYTNLLARHNELFEELCSRFAGAQILKHTGDGYFAAFGTASDAVRFALLLQHCLRNERWNCSPPLAARVGIHVGEVALVRMAGHPDVVGLAADLAARLMSLAQGGQILLTRAAFDDARQFVEAHPEPAGNGVGANARQSHPRIKWLAHGRYQFKGAREPLEVFEVGAEGAAPLCPPTGGEKGKRLLTRNELPTLGWRPAKGQPIPHRPGWQLQRKLANAGFGEVWLGRNDGNGQRRVFKFCFNPGQVDGFASVSTLYRVGPEGAGGAADQPIFTESDYTDDHTALRDVEGAGSSIQRIDAQDHPRQIGPYLILEVIGEGGMGVVYKAEQRHPVRRTVALKLIKLGMDTRETIARFESERQALALMNHPNVARVLDAGATEAGRPYFVMEYVPGEPITTFCDRQKYTVKQRLELFSQGCEAVQHAHQKAILHRDLKPSNMLVMLQDGEPVVKVIDFGVAKALAQKLTERTLFTSSGHFVGTPEYMSPEQATMTAVDVDTRSDIYSLGVVLYELLAGALPFDPQNLRSAGIAEIERIIREVEPPRPSARFSGLGAAAAADVAQRRQTRIDELSRQLRSELEWIPLKAMCKERALRYATARELTADIQNYLAHRPLVAGPQSTAYRLKKFLKRRRGLVTAVASVLVVLLIGVAATGSALLWGSRLRAELAALRLQVPPVALDRFSNAGVADAQAQLGATGWDLKDRGRFEEAEAVFRRAYELSAKVLGESNLDTLAYLNNWGLVLLDLGRVDEAAGALQRAYEGKKALLGAENPAVIRAMDGYAYALLAQGRSDEAEQMFREELQISMRVLPHGDPGIFFTMDNLAHVLYDKGRLDEAEQFVRQALEGRRRILGDEHRDTLVSMNNLAEVLERRGEHGEAERLYRQALAQKRNAFGPNHVETLTTMYNLGGLLADVGRLQDAEACFAELHRRAADAAGDPAQLAEYMAYWGLCLVKLHRYDEAIEPLRMTQARIAAIPQPHPDRIKGIAVAVDSALHKASGTPARAEGALSGVPPPEPVRPPTTQPPAPSQD